MRKASMLCLSFISLVFLTLLSTNEALPKNLARTIYVDDVTSVQLEGNDTAWSLTQVNKNQERQVILEGSTGTEPVLDRVLEPLGQLTVTGSNGALWVVRSKARLEWRCKMKAGKAEVKCKATENVESNKSLRYKLKFAQLEVPQSLKSFSRSESTDYNMKLTGLALKSACIKLKPYKNSKHSQLSKNNSDSQNWNYDFLDEFAMHLTYNDTTATDGLVEIPEACAVQNRTSKGRRNKRKCKVSMLMLPKLANGMQKFDDFLTDRKFVMDRLKVHTNRPSSDFNDFLRQYVNPDSESNLREVECLDLAGTKEDSLCPVSRQSWVVPGTKSLRVMRCGLEQNIEIGGSIEALDLSQNHLQDFPKGSETLEKLVFLNMSRQALAPGQTFSLRNAPQFPNVQSMDLSHNNITDLESTYVSRFPMLESLRLQNCNIEILPENLFNGVPRLLYIDLSYNQLRTLPSEIFLYLAPGFLARLSHNQLANVDNLKVADDQRYQLELDNNPLYNKVEVIKVNDSNLTSTVKLTSKVRSKKLKKYGKEDYFKCPDH